MQIPLCENTHFNNLPYKVETNGQGQIIVTPHSNLHSDYQVEIALLLKKLITYGRISLNFSVYTLDGEKTIDVTWRTNISKDKVASTIPELCIEVESPYNTIRELYYKRDLYLKCGAKEVWIYIDGKMRFFTKNGQRGESKLFPIFPTFINL